MGANRKRRRRFERQNIGAGDGAAIREEDTLFFDNAADAEILLFDMADIKFN